MEKRKKRQEACDILYQKIEQCKAEQQKLLSALQDLQEQYLDRKISYQEYQRTLSKKYDEKTIEEWLKYYNQYIALCEEKILTYKKNARKEKIKLFSASFCIIGILALLILGIWYITQKKVSLAPPESIIEAHADIINITFTSSTEYLWAPKQSGQLASVKLSGTMQGTGSATIFLEEFLLFDSIQQPNITIFDEICESTCSLETNNLSSPSYFIRIELLNSTFYLDNITYSILTPAPYLQEPEPIPPDTKEKIFEEFVVQQQAEIGKPVIWKKTITRKKSGLLEFSLPDQAQKIQIKKLDNRIENDITASSIIKKKNNQISDLKQ